jgi:S-layer homology domain
MDISRMKKMFAGVSAVAMTLTSVGTAFAAYSDVPAGVWYEDAVDAFVDAGYLDSSQTRFRGGDNANRAEFVKLVVELNGGILSTAPSVPSFDDVKPGSWYYGYMEEAGKEGWVTGDGKCYGTHPCWARPAANINRAEAAAIIVRAFGLEWTGEAPKFVDNAAGQWYTDAIQTAADHCVLQGDDSTGRVRPADNMNRAEMVVMLHRVDMNMSYEDCASDPTGPMEAGIKAVVPTSATKLEVEFNTALDQDDAVMASRYKVTGDSSITVSSVKWMDDMTVELTLASAMTADASYTLSVMDLMTEDGETFSDTASFDGFSALPKGDGELEVSVASSNPVGDTVPKGANGVVLMSLDLSASCDDSVSLSNLTVLHEGFGSETDIDGIYATVDGARVSRKRTIDSQDQTSDLRFTSPLTVAACGTKTVDIVADFNSTAVTAAEHNIAVELASDFMSNARSVTGNFPMRGNTFKVAAVTSGKITIEYRSVSPTKVEVGDMGKVLGKFEVSTDSVEDQTIYSMTVQNDGSSDDDSLNNLKIRRTDGTVLTNTVAMMDDGYATFVFDPPFTVLQGDKITLEVVGDVVGGAADDIQMIFEETSDIFGVGSLYGYGVNGQLYGSQVRILTSTTATTVTIDAGQFTVEIDGPVQQKYTRTSKDAVLANVLFATGDEQVEVRRMFMAIEAQTSSGAGFGAGVNVSNVLEDVTLRNKNTGQSVSAVRLTSQGTATTGDFFSNTSETWQIYRFDDFTINGKEMWEVRADFINNGIGARPTNGDRFRVHICGESENVLDSNNALTTNTTGCSFGGLITSSTSYQMEVEGLTTGDEIGDVRPRGTITGNYHRIANPELTVAVQSIGASDTAVRNSKNINLLRFQARAGEAEDVLFTSAIFAAGTGSLLNGQNYTLWVDTDGDGTVDTILEEGAAAQSNQVSFDELAGGGYVIPAEETVIFEVHANIAASLTNDELRLRFATGSTFVEAEQADDGSSLSGINLNGTCSSTCDIIVTTTQSKRYDLIAQGDLFVTKSSTPVRSRQLLGGTIGDPILRLQFRAQNEDIDVTNLQLNSSGSTATSVERLDLYKAGETTAFASATTGGCGSDDYLATNPGNGGAAIVAFCASMQNRQLVVKKGQNLDVLVYPRMKTDEQGATSNQTIQLWITPQAVATNLTNSGSIRARGAQSSNNLNPNRGGSTSSGAVFIGRDTTGGANAAIVGNKNVSVLAKITQIVNAGPADNTAVPTGLDKPIGEFKFTAATNNNTLNGLNKAVLSGVIFTVNATNINLDGGTFQFYNKADASTKASCTILGSQSNSGALKVQCAGLPSTSVNTEIQSGQSATFALEVDVTDSDVVGSNTSTLQVSIGSFSDLANTTFGTSNSNISWLDKDTTTTTFYWVEYPETVVNGTSYKS